MHTPGPWKTKANKTRIYTEDIRVIGPEGESVALIPADDTIEIEGGAIAEVLTETAEANARLVAAAPEMLDMLKRLLKHPGFIKPFEKSTTVMVMRALIAKAEGR